MKLHPLLADLGISYIQILWPYVCRITLSVLEPTPGCPDDELSVAESSEINTMIPDTDETSDAFALIWHAGYAMLTFF